MHQGVTGPSRLPRPAFENGHDLMPVSGWREPGPAGPSRSFELGHGERKSKKVKSEKKAKGEVELRPQAMPGAAGEDGEKKVIIACHLCRAKKLRWVDCSDIHFLFLVPIPTADGMMSLPLER